MKRSGICQDFNFFKNSTPERIQKISHRRAQKYTGKGVKSWQKLQPKDRIQKSNTEQKNKTEKS